MVYRVARWRRISFQRFRTSEINLSNLDNSFLRSNERVSSFRSPVIFASQLFAKDRGFLPELLSPRRLFFLLPFSLLLFHANLVLELRRLSELLDLRKRWKKRTVIEMRLVRVTLSRLYFFSSARTIRWGSFLGLIHVSFMTVCVN